MIKIKITNNHFFPTTNSDKNDICKTLSKGGVGAQRNPSSQSTDIFGWLEAILPQLVRIAVTLELKRQSE